MFTVCLSYIYCRLGNVIVRHRSEVQIGKEIGIDVQELLLSHLLANFRLLKQYSEQNDVCAANAMGCLRKYDDWLHPTRGLLPQLLRSGLPSNLQLHILKVGHEMATNAILKYDSFLR